MNVAKVVLFESLPSPPTLQKQEGPCILSLEGSTRHIIYVGWWLAIVMCFHFGNNVLTGTFIVLQERPENWALQNHGREVLPTAKNNVSCHCAEPSV